MAHKLTDKQQWVLDLVNLNMRVTDIAKATGLSVKRVSNIKKRLRDLGLDFKGAAWTEDNHPW